MEGHGIKGLGGLFVAGAAGLFASHLGMTEWKVIAIMALVGLGLPMLASGRLSKW